MILKPGKYTYKYVIDGKWTNDIFNKQAEDDLKGGYNSVFFCYNYRFVLDGYTDAKRVIVAGSFNNWNEKELKMILFNGKWIFHLYLREGTHAYKFIVDKEWITDPANKITRPDGTGHMNSFLGIGDTLYFTLKGYPEAEKVVLTGNFNAWNTGELFMAKTAEGWKLPYVLAAGNYEYKYIVDGKWITDPGDPFTSGEGNYTNSVLVVKPNHTFVLKKHFNASEVILSGSFNGWSPKGYKMVQLDGY
jgi:1,4-alpha-glucan branching enzyme